MKVDLLHQKHKQHFLDIWRGWWDTYLLAYEAKPKLKAKRVSVSLHVVQPELSDIL